MRKRVWGLGAAAAVAGAACLFPDLGDLSGAGDADAADAKPIDAPFDAATTDAGPTDATFCKRADHSLCDDFDELPLGAAWSSQHVASAELSVVDAAFASAPNSLSSLVSSPVTGSAAYLQKDFAGSISRVVCEAKIRVATLANGAVLSFQLAATPASANVVTYTLSFVQGASKTTFSESLNYADGDAGGISVDLTPPMVADAGTWTHMTLDANFAAHSIAITFDGASVLATSILAPANSGETIRFGIQEYFGTLASIRYDDIACDVTP